MNELKPLKLDKKKKISFLKTLVRYKWFLIIIAAVFLVALWWQGSSSTSVFKFALGRGAFLQEENGRINVLLLGIAGGNHDGPNLTDTIMVVSYDTSSKKADLISLPRDLWIEKYKAKVNTFYQLGLTRGNGLDFPRSEIGQILGLDIPYAVRIDFGGFVKAADLIGGLDVDVEQSFDDFVYPIPGKETELCGNKEDVRDISDDQAKSLGVESGKIKVLLDSTDKIATAAAKPGADFVFTDQQVVDLFPCRYEHLTFTKGLTNMDGETALKFVRSRHGTGSEGSDFARSKRQQLVLQAFKNKVLSVGTLSDLVKVTGLIGTLGASVDSNIPVSKYPEFIKLIKQSDKTESFVIDSKGDSPLLITPSVGDYGAWVLIPQDNDFTKIQQHVSDVLSGTATATASAVKKQ